MEIIRKYEASFGKWYVQVRLDGAMVEFCFDSEPDDATVQANYYLGAADQ